MADEAKDEVKKEGKGLLIILIALVLVLTLSVIGGAFFLYSQGIFDKESDKKTEVQQTAKETSQTYKAEVNDLVLNITSSQGKGKLMKLSFAVKSSEPTIQALVDENKAEIIDTVIGQISSRNSEELLTVGGKKLLKEELVTDINSVLDSNITSEEVIRGSVKKILFTSFVIK